MISFSKVQTKPIKECIEFYYLWKKVNSDTAKKKWKSLKKRRYIEHNNIEQSLRSRQIMANAAAVTAASDDNSNNNNGDVSVVDHLDDYAANISI